MRAKGNTEEARTLNSYLDAIRLKINQTELQLQYQGTTLTLSNFKEAYSGKKGKSTHHHTHLSEPQRQSKRANRHRLRQSHPHPIRNHLSPYTKIPQLEIPKRRLRHTRNRQHLHQRSRFLPPHRAQVREQHRNEIHQKLQKNNPHMPSQRMDHHRSIHQLQIQVHPNRENPPQPRRARPTYSQDPNQRTTNTRTRHLPIRLLHRTSLHRHQTTNHQKHSQRHRWPKLDKHTQTKNRRPLQHPTVRSRTKHLVQIPRPSKRQSRKHAAPHSQQPKKWTPTSKKLLTSVASTKSSPSIAHATPSPPPSPYPMEYR